MKKSQLLRLLELLSIHQEVWEYVGSAYQSELTPFESYLVLELSAGPGQTASEIARNLEQERTTISPRIKSLLKMGFIREESSKEDKRAKNLFLDEAATPFVEEHLRFTAAKLAELTRNLSALEFSRLLSFFKKFADGAGVGSVRLAPGEDVALQEGRRLFRALGVSGSDFVESGYSDTEWHILRTLSLAQRDWHAVELSQRFSIHKATLSKLLGRFQERGLLVAKASSNDRRSKSLTLSESGEDVVRTIQRSFVAYAKRCLRGLNSEELEDFNSLLARYVGAASILPVRVLQNELKVVELNREEREAEARAFLLYHVVRSNQHLSCRGCFIGAGSVVFLLLEGQQIRGVLEFQEGPQYWRLEYFVCSPEYESGDIATRFLKVAMKDAFKRTNQEKFEIPSKHSVLNCLRDIDGRTGVLFVHQDSNDLKSLLNV